MTWRDETSRHVILFVLCSILHLTPFECFVVVRPFVIGIPVEHKICIDPGGIRAVKDIETEFSALLFTRTAGYVGVGFDAEGISFPRR
mmetsp:Transcript_9125/g.19765  ORF Transcript_9125/g.19765 Transcript_9125/m.19765 type:complete len:88 (-) Transcript_9125:1467-1730(-)